MRLTSCATTKANSTRDGCSSGNKSQRQELLELIYGSLYNNNILLVRIGCAHDAPFLFVITGHPGLTDCFAISLSTRSYNVRVFYFDLTAAASLLREPAISGTVISQRIGMVEANDSAEISQLGTVLQRSSVKRLLFNGRESYGGTDSRIKSRDRGTLH